jgi:SAM-dependent methyltransferase
MDDASDEADAASVDMDPERHYDEFGAGEWNRLEANPVTRFEYENTLDELREWLPDSGEVLDAGGGPGRYSVWLADRGHAVEHLDVSAEQVRLARDAAADRGLDDRITCRKGDVVDLPFDDDRFAAACCLGGPISHVVDADDRAAAVRELRRVTAPGGPVFVSVIGRLTAIRDTIRHGLDDHPGILPDLGDSGDYTEELVAEHGSDGWAECHFFRADEFETLLGDAGLAVERLVGLEGPASVMEPELADASEEAVDAVREVVRALRYDRSVVDLSAHLLAVCRA